MKVLWLAPYPLNALGNLPVKHRVKSQHPATWIVNLSDALTENYPSLDLHILTETAYVSKSFSMLRKNITFHVVRSGGAIPFLLRGYPGKFRFDVWTNYFINCFRISNVIQIVKPDLIHTHGTETCYSYAAIKSFPKDKVIISLQGIMNHILRDQVSWTANKMKNLECFVINNGCHFIAKTTFAHQFIEQNNKSACIYHIENAVHDSFWRVGWCPQKNVVLFVGSVIKEKGIENLITAVKTVPNALLHIIGSGPESYNRYLKKLVINLGLSQRVRWLGYLDSTNIAQEFSHAKVLVLPSHMENSPNVLIEAMSVGLPVIANDVGGIRNLLREYDRGSVINTNNINELSRALIASLNTLKDAQPLYDRSIFQNRFHKRYVSEKYFKIYNQIIR